MSLKKFVVHFFLKSWDLIAALEPETILYFQNMPYFNMLETGHAKIIEPVGMTQVRATIMPLLRFEWTMTKV